MSDTTLTLIILAPFIGILVALLDSWDRKRSIHRTPEVDAYIKKRLSENKSTPQD